jgi:predicted ATPase/DNA-binding XRE family transcriptional regulator
MEQNSFGYWLKLKRKALDLTREELAKQVGYSAATIRKIEDEERHPSAQVVERLAEFLKIPQNERESFLRFARGDWKSAPTHLDEEIPWQSSTKSVHSNLPAPLTSLIGREKEIKDVREYLAKEDIRLVTLLGPPGIGKTRLSIEAARTVLPDFPDGVFFVALALLDDPTLIASAVVQALGFMEAGKVPADKQLEVGIGEKQMLIVLDNCEHLIEGVASLASSLLSACSRLKILVTSRESVRILGEWLYPVPAFAVPEGSASIDIEMASTFPALTLFAERARTVRPDFALDIENVKMVSAICAQLDGLPLAIELIAARIRLMSPQALLERLNDQFILSADGMRAVSTRQKTLNDAIGWSYSLLSAEEQKLFAYLSVFWGGFTLEAAEAMFARAVKNKPISDLITLLLDKSLLQRTSDALSGTRFTMLVTIQQFARDRLRETGEETQVCNWHLAHFSELAKQSRPHLRSSDQLEWLDRLDVECDNIRAALSWAQARGFIAMGLYLATDLEMFWIYRAHLREPCFAIENLLAASPSIDQIHALARGHLVAGTLQMFLANFDLAYAHAKESERLFLQLGPTYKADLADARNLIVYTGVDFIGDPVQSRQALEDNLKLFQEAGDRWQIAHTLFNIGDALRHSGHLTSARQAYEQSLVIFRECGDNIRVVHQEGELAAIAFAEGKYLEARKRYEEVLSFYRQARFNLLISIPLYMLGMIAIREGDYARAKAWFLECLLFEQQIGTSFLLSECLIGFAGIASSKRRFEHAAQMLGTAEMQVEARQFPLGNTDQAEVKRLTTILREELGDAEFETLDAKGRAMTMEQAIAYALEDHDY